MTYQIETDKSPKRRSFVQSIWDIGVISALVILAFTAQSGNSGQQQSASSPAKPISAAQVAANPREFQNRKITVRSRPVQRLGVNSFKVRDGFFSQQEPLLVVNASRTPFNLPANVDVQITGQVRDFVISDIERDYKINLNEDLHGNYVGKPVLIAENITLAPQPNQVTQAPQQFYGKTIAVAGEVENVKNPILMTLQKDEFIKGKDLPVLMTSSPKVAINKGQKVAVVGEVRPFVATEIERDYNFSWNPNVKQQLESEYRDTPVLIAEAVYP
jgi:hypothetical protein